jgi:hypothetical protein
LLVLESNLDEALAALLRETAGTESDVELPVVYALEERRKDALDAIAISLIEERLGVDSGAFLALVELNPMWDSLRDHPDYAAMITRSR